MRKVWFNAKAMASRSAYEGYIKWIAIHLSKLEEYTLWWNGGTIWEMLRDEVQFNHEDVHITLQAMILTLYNDISLDNV
jgi:hypothetical protein